jgi:hypothetical protein
MTRDQALHRLRARTDPESYLAPEALIDAVAAIFPVEAADPDDPALGDYLATLAAGQHDLAERTARPKPAPDPATRVLCLKPSQGDSRPPHGRESSRARSPKARFAGAGRPRHLHAVPTHVTPWSRKPDRALPINTGLSTATRNTTNHKP